MPPARRIILAAVMAMSLGLSAVVVLEGFSTQSSVKLKINVPARPSSKTART